MILKNSIFRLVDRVNFMPSEFLIATEHNSTIYYKNRF